MTSLRTPDTRARLDVPSKECRVCQKPFFTTNSMMIVCGLRCAQRIPAFNRKAERAERKADKAKLEAIKPRSKWLQEAQGAFNAWIRKRDEFLECISCGATSGKMNACHYRSVGANPELRFEPLNVHKGCERCNTYLHGNLISYRLVLGERIGWGRLAWLEGPHAPKKYTVDDLRAIRDTYRAKLKELQS